MDLLVHEVVQLQHVHDADGDVLVERLTGAAVEEIDCIVAEPCSSAFISSSWAPSNTGVATCMPSFSFCGELRELLRRAAPR